jgi:hypothetical protein
MALTTATFNTADVPAVQQEALNVAFRHLINEGRGLALFNGLAEGEIRDVEAALWDAFPDQAETRLAAALRFRALLNAFGAKRLKDMLLQNGFRSIQAAVNEAAKQRLNARYGFRQQHFVMALAGLAAPVPHARDVAELALAA